MPATLTPFLTDLDSRAAIKGSRDPLGLVPLWSRFGRTVVGNLTTASGSLRGFTTLLLGHWLAERVQERDGREAESTLELFLKFEQLAGYVRVHLNDDAELRGIDRVRLNLSTSRGAKVPIGAEQERQILANQRTYGIWGLYSTPAASSGLLVPGEYTLTPEARRFVEQHYIPRLSAEGVREGRAVVELLRRRTAEVHLEGRDSALAKGLAKLLAPKLTAAEREFYDFHLVRGGPADQTAGRQALLADLLAELPDSWFGFEELRHVITRARKRPDGEPLAERLLDIEHLESVIVPLDNAFLHLLAREGQPIEKVASELADQWGKRLKHIVPETIRARHAQVADAYGGEGKPADRLAEAAEALAEGDYETVLRLLLAHNTFVMKARGSDPWARLERGKISVQYRDESGRLIPGDELADWWQSTYFINSLHGIVRAVRGA